MTETLANGYSSESTQRELSNEYQHDRVRMFFKNVCVVVLWAKVASALEGLNNMRLSYSILVFCIVFSTGINHLVRYTIMYCLKSKNRRNQGLGQDFKNACPKQQFQNFCLSRFSYLSTSNPYSIAHCVKKGSLC